MTTDRIEEIIKQTAYPESNSVLQALHQVWNEVQQENNERIGSCEKCKQYTVNELGSYCYLTLVDMSKDDFCSKFEKDTNEQDVHQV